MAKAEYSVSTSAVTEPAVYSRENWFCACARKRQEEQERHEQPSPNNED